MRREVGAVDTCDWLLAEEIIFHRFHTLYGQRSLDSIRSILEDESPWKRRVILFDGLDLMSHSASDVDEHYGLLFLILESVLPLSDKR